MTRALLLLALLPSLALAQQKPSAVNAAGVSNKQLVAPSFRLLPATALPAAPTTGRAEFAFQDIAGIAPPWMASIGTAGVPTFTFPFVGLGNGHSQWGCLMPTNKAASTLVQIGTGLNTGPIGTASAQTWAATTNLTRSSYVTYTVASAAVNLNAGQFANTHAFWRGANAGEGGFVWWGSWGINGAYTTPRIFMGLTGSTTVMTATADPSASINAIYFGHDAAGDGNLSICSNDGAGTASCTTLGATFPVKTSGATYTGFIWAAPNASTVSWAIRRHDSAQTASGSLSSDLPVTTGIAGAMNAQMIINSGSTAESVAITFYGECGVANP